MIDGIKILDLSVSVDALLQNNRLLFPLPVDEQTGAVLDQPRRGSDRGLTFTLTPRQTGGYRIELKGSIHRYYRNGVHNADDFTAADLLAALNQLVTTYAIDPFTSRLNNVEFGVNVELQFPVNHVLENLISYKYRPFTKEPGEGFNYYQCQTQRYIIKLYDKGSQYRNVEPYLRGNVLRVEVKVLKMEYLTRQGIRLDWLVDLLITENYGPLGALLVKVFTEILFDEPTIDTAKLTTRERDVYLNGRNPRFWSMPDNLKSKEYNAHRQHLHRAEHKFRALLDKHRQGDNWQSLTAMLISLTWERLTAVDNKLQTQIKKRLKAWYNSVEVAWKENNNDHKIVMDLPLMCHNLTGLVKVFPKNCHKLTGISGKISSQKCHKLTGLATFLNFRGTPTFSTEKCHKLTGSENGKMSQINPLSMALICDIAGNDEQVPNASRGTSETGINSEDFSLSEVEVFPQNLNRVLASSEREEEVVSVSPKNSLDNNDWPACEKKEEDCSDVVAGVSHRRSCPVTGLDISHQLPTTRFVTATTLKRLFVSNRQVFEQLAEQFLPADWVYFEPESRSHNIAYAIRFLDNQRRHQARKLAAKAQKSTS